MEPMTESDIAYHAQWKAASGHPKGWRVVRQFFAPHPQADCGFQELNNKAGRLILFKTREAAVKRAAELNTPVTEADSIIAKAESLPDGGIKILEVTLPIVATERPVYTVRFSRTRRKVIEEYGFYCGFQPGDFPEFLRKKVDRAHARRTLDAYNATNKRMIERAIAIVKRDGLIIEAQQAYRAAKEASLKAAINSAFDADLAPHAGEMLEALKGVVNAMAGRVHSRDAIAALSRAGELVDKVERARYPADHRIDVVPCEPPLSYEAAIAAICDMNEEILEDYCRGMTPGKSR